jgi:hypothetical protein
MKSIMDRVGSLTTAMKGDVKPAFPGSARVGHVNIANAAQTGPGESRLIEWLQAARVVRINRPIGESVGIQVPQQKLGSVVPGFDHERQRMFRAVARRKPALAGEGLNRHAVIGRARGLHVNIGAEKPVEISEAFGDSGGDDLIEVSTEQPNSGAGKVRRIIDLTRPIGRIDRPMGILCRRRPGRSPQNRSPKVCVQATTAAEPGSSLRNGQKGFAMISAQP